MVLCYNFDTLLLLGPEVEGLVGLRYTGLTVAVGFAVWGSGFAVHAAARPTLVIEHPDSRHAPLPVLGLRGRGFRV